MIEPGIDSGTRIRVHRDIGNRSIVGYLKQSVIFRDDIFLKKEV
jgi:hypothetical protein